MAATAMTGHAEPRIDGASKTAAYLFLVSIFATAIAAIVGFLFIIAISFPFSLVALFMLPQISGWLWNGAILAAPVTLVFLPIAVVVGRQHPVILYFALPLVGLIGGIIAMKLWPQVGAHWPELSGPTKNLSFIRSAFIKELGPRINDLDRRHSRTRFRRILLCGHS
jgi:hypothetical protein